MAIKFIRVFVHLYGMVKCNEDCFLLFRIHIHFKGSEDNCATKTAAVSRKNYVIYIN